MMINNLRIYTILKVLGYNPICIWLTSVYTLAMISHDLEKVCNAILYYAIVKSPILTLMLRYFHLAR